MTAPGSGLAARFSTLRLPAGRSTTVVDMAGVESLTRADAVALVRAERRFRANGRHLTLVNTSRAVRRQLIVLGLGALLRRPVDG